MKISRNILSVPAEDMEIVVVTGTNGKTTTCNMIEHALTDGGHDCHRDKSGANLLHGITSDLLCDTNWLGKPNNHYAVLEVDEAALKQVVPLIHPKAIVVTNLFTDQADRFGSVENTRKEIKKGIKRSPESILVLNAQDTQSAQLDSTDPSASREMLISLMQANALNAEVITNMTIIFTPIWADSAAPSAVTRIMNRMSL